MDPVDQEFAILYAAFVAAGGFDQPCVDEDWSRAYWHRSRPIKQAVSAY